MIKTPKSILEDNKTTAEVADPRGLFHVESEDDLYEYDEDIPRALEQIAEGDEGVSPNGTKVS